MKCVTYLILRTFLFPLSLLPSRILHSVGKGLGLLAYTFYPKFRKRTLSNIALALNPPEKELKRIAKKSMQNLMITLLDYSQLHTKLATCQNPQLAESLIKEGKGIIFFCAHQANWEVLFVEGTNRMPGVAIGRPIKNSFLYNWILKLRQQNGGKIITPQNAIREGLKALKRGAFLGIVGDQGMPDSGFSSPFFGKRAWTSPMPALLSFRTGCPIMVATTKREKGKYHITYSDPIWPSKEAPQETEIPRLMHTALHLLEESIRKAPEEWLWQHNRWKQQPPGRVKRTYRQESLLIILPHEPLAHLEVFREIYPLEFITLLTPTPITHSLAEVETILYRTPQERFLRNYQYKLVFNLTSEKKITKHYTQLGATQVVNMPHFTPEALRTLCLITATS